MPTDPKRMQSDLTIVIDRSRILSAEAREALRDAPTLVECPWCDAAGMVPFEKRVEWITAYPELDKSDNEIPTMPPPQEKP